MAVFADTSGFFAVLDKEDTKHGSAEATWERLLVSREPLITHSYVLSETFGIVQRRLGVEAIRRLASELLPLVEVEWVDALLHRRAVGAMVAAGSRRISLVDYVSFEVMARRGIETAFAFDDDFLRAGFTLLG